MALPVFPALIGLDWPVLRTPDWSNTDVQRSVTGKRTTLARQSYPFYRYELSHSLLRSDAANLEWQTLLSFYNSVNGPANLFRYTDPADGTATAQAIATGDGVTQNFQLVRTLSGIGASFTDPVFYPTAAQLFDNGSPIGGGSYTLGPTGNIFMNLAAGHVLSWTGTFDWLCRFDDSSATFEQFMITFWALKKIKFSTEKF